MIGQKDIFFLQVNHEGNPKIKMEQVKEIAPTQQFSFPTSQTQAPKTYTRKKKPITSLLTPKLEPIDTEIVIKQEQTST